MDTQTPSPDNSLPPIQLGPNDPIPEGMIPIGQPQPIVLGENDPLPEGFISTEDYKEQKYGTPVEMAKTAVEQGLSGATLGLSKVIETHGMPAFRLPFPGIPGGIPIPAFGPISTSENIKGREEENPLVATGFNVAGTIAPIVATGGLGALAEGANLATRIGLSALEGAGISGVNTITDDWSQNKALDAEKIAVNTGLGALLGFGGGALAEGVGAVAKKGASLLKLPKAVEESAVNAATEANAVFDPFTKKTPSAAIDPAVEAAKETHSVASGIIGMLKSMDLGDIAKFIGTAALLHGEPTTAVTSYILPKALKYIDARYGLQEAARSALIKNAGNISKGLDSGVKALFSGVSSQSRKIGYGE